MDDVVTENGQGGVSSQAQGTYAPASGEIGSRFVKKLRERLAATPLGARPRFTSIAKLRKLGDLRPTDASLAARFYGGDFSLAGHAPAPGDHSPFLTANAPVVWLEELHGFRWLRHLAASDFVIHHNHAATCILDWVDDHQGPRETVAWRSDIVARRIISWHQHVPDLMLRHGAGRDRKVLKSLLHQARFLERNLYQLSTAFSRLHAAIALTCSALCLARSKTALGKASRRLDLLLDQQIAADGMHVSRNPQNLVSLLLDLLPLKAAFLEADIVPSDALVGAIDRALSCLCLMRHKDGSLAQFNGTGPSPDAELACLDPFLPVTANTPGGVQKSAPHGGYERFEAGSTVLILDTATPAHAPPSAMLAGALAFELSSGSHPFIINCGVPATSSPPYATFYRASAAHSTAIIADTSSTREREGVMRHAENWLPGHDGVRNPTRSRTQRGAWCEVTASHDGYRRPFGLIHHRLITMRDDGDAINGADSFVACQNTAIGSDIDYPCVLRFHLHPNVSASKLSNGHSILLAGADGEAWTLTCVDAPMRLEESIWFAAPEGPRKTEQVVIQATTGTCPEIRWTLRRKARPVLERTARPKNETGDLLSLFNAEPKSGEGH